MYNVYFYIIVLFLAILFIFEKFVDYLNTLNWSNKLPKEALGIYDEEKYAKSQAYEKEKHKFFNLLDIFNFLVTFLALAFGAFGLLDTYLRNYFQNPILLSLGFFGIIFLIQTLLKLPFFYHLTFVIEEKFGFNKMTKKLFFVDTVKTFFLTLLIGSVVLSVLILIYSKLGANFWWIAWITLSLILIFVNMFYSSFIIPLFNKQTPLEDGELKAAISNFADKVGFKIDNVFVIDGSKRSSKANAYFLGFGPKKRVILYDTLLSNLNIEEIVAVLAHEIGHYKKRHVLKMLLLSILQIGLMMFLLSLVVENEEIAKALGADFASFHIGLVAFFMLFAPINFIFGIFGNIVSRKNEYEADNFAKENQLGDALIEALKKLSVNNLPNLLPHRVYEFIHYSHPTVLKRIEALKQDSKSLRSF